MEDDTAIFDAVPKMLIDFAKKSQVDGGYCLLQRYVWHALDRKTLSLYNKSATLLVHGNGVGLKLHLDIPASTKQSLQIIHREGNLMLLLYLLMLF